jgi:hypothetical protein
MPIHLSLGELGPLRSLTNKEWALVRRLLEQDAGASSKLLSHADSWEVQEMADGGMGSLYFVRPGTNSHDRHFGRRIAELQFDDVDGARVIASLNVDKDGYLFELDVWRTDFKPIIRLDPPL